MILKNFLALILVTLIIFFAARYFYLGLHGLLYLHAQVLRFLSLIFTHGKIAELIRNTLAVLAVPLVIGSVGGMLLAAFKRDKTRCVVMTVWAVWLILITILVYK